MTKILIFLFVLISQFVNAQLSNIYKKGNSWTVSGYYYTNINIPPSNRQQVHYKDNFEVLRDTLINGINFGIIYIDFQSNWNGSPGKSKIYLGKKDNIFFEYFPSANKIDTVAKFHGLEIGDSVHFYNSIFNKYVFISEITEIVVNNHLTKKYKFRGKSNTLTFRNFFIDGLGFLGFGPVPSEQGQYFEGNRALTCFGNDNKFYGFEDGFIDGEYDDVTVSNSTSPCFSPLDFTRVPISLFEETTKWNVTSVSIDGICGRGAQTDINYRNVGDTVISGLIFKKLDVISSKYAILNLGGTCPVFQYRSSIFIRNTSNRIIKYKLAENKADTLFYITGTTLNDSVKIAGDNSYSKIIKIDSVVIGNKKYRRFQFKSSNDPSFNFIDGVGFSSSGPIPSSIPQCQGERGSVLKCFELNKSTYTQVGSCESTYEPSSTMCSSILTLIDNNLVGEVKTNFNNSTKVLEISIMADEIHVYNLSGLEVASVRNSKVLTLNMLRPGLYFSYALLNNSKSVYKFQIQD